ncbi:MAG: hypothetical protein R3C17_02140 [Planctomycetaceae bacterium]
MSLKRFLAATAGSLASLAIVGQSLIAQDPSLYSELEPETIFSGGVQYLAMTRDSNLSPAPNVINGPDSGNVGFQDSDFNFRSGVRAFLSAESSGARIDAVFSNYGNFTARDRGSLTQGLAFDDGLGTAWAGANSITNSTFFSPLANAATPALGGEADEFEGLGPNGGFPGDALPTWQTWYKSQIQAIELNLLTADHESLFQYGIGYANWQLDEAAGVQISGAFRATDTAGPNNGLSHASLTGVGGLGFSGGTPNGFQDETGNASGIPDTLTLFREARTDNNLNGIQAIMQQEVMYYRGIVVNGILKAGVYHNSAHGSILERYSGVDTGPGGDTSNYGRSFSDSASSIAFVGTVGLQSSVPLTNHWSLIGGYEATFINGVALAPDQNLTSNGTTYNINTHGNVLLHGANAGLQFAY